jgi:hypothetical protein
VTLPKNFPTNESALRAEVDRIIALSNDDEAAHSAEDALWLHLIETFCPEWVVTEVSRLCSAPFNRWSA